MRRSPRPPARLGVPLPPLTFRTTTTAISTTTPPTAAMAVIMLRLRRCSATRRAEARCGGRPGLAVLAELGLPAGRFGTPEEVGAPLGRGGTLPPPERCLVLAIYAFPLMRTVDLPPA